MPRKLNPSRQNWHNSSSARETRVRQIAETCYAHAAVIYRLSGGGRLSAFSVPLLPVRRDKPARCCE
jgi:hypothetical protein